jgi:hypothetical protein
MYDEFIGNENLDSLMLRAAGADPSRQPGFILFTGDQDLQGRIISARRYFPFIVYETTIEPGLIDKVMHFLNPVNQVNRVTIYRNTCLFPEKVRK